MPSSAAYIQLDAVTFRAPRGLGWLRSLAMGVGVVGVMALAAWSLACFPTRSARSGGGATSADAEELSVRSTTNITHELGKITDEDYWGSFKAVMPWISKCGVAGCVALCTACRKLEAKCMPCLGGRQFLCHESYGSWVPMRSILLKDITYNEARQRLAEGANMRQACCKIGPKLPRVPVFVGVQTCLVFPRVSAFGHVDHNFFAMGLIASHSESSRSVCLRLASCLSVDAHL